MDLGTELPGLTTTDQDGQSVNLADYRSEPFVLVYFYPKADTPGCTKQACSLRDAYAELNDQNITVFGVSGDSVNAQKAFQEKFSLPFRLLADEDKAVIEAFGVPAMGKFPKRQAFLFESGKLIWKDESASTEQQAADVLAFLKNRNAG